MVEFVGIFAPGLSGVAVIVAVGGSGKSVVVCRKTSDDAAGAFPSEMAVLQGRQQLRAGEQLLTLKLKKVGGIGFAG